MVIASRVEIHEDHLVFLNSNGELRYLFMLETVESWAELEV